MDKPSDTKKIDVSRTHMDRDLPSHLAQTNNLSIWNDIDEADRRRAVDYLLALEKCGLEMALEKRFGDDLQAKIDCLKRRLKVSSLTAIEALALKQVLADLSAEKERRRSL